MSKKRSANFSEDDKSTFLDLIAEDKNNLTSRSNDTKALLRKQQAWERLVVRYNSVSSQPRDKSSLINLWKNMKVLARKEIGDQNKKRRQTGNISTIEDLSINTSRLQSLMPEEFVKPTCAFDDDSQDDSVTER